MTESAPMPLYNEFTFFLKKYFPYKVQNISQCGFYMSQPGRNEGAGRLYIL